MPIVLSSPLSWECFWRGRWVTLISVSGNSIVSDTQHEQVAPHFPIIICVKLHHPHCAVSQMHNCAWWPWTPMVFTFMCIVVFLTWLKMPREPELCLYRERLLKLIAKDSVFTTSNLEAFIFYDHIFLSYKLEIFSQWVTKVFIIWLLKKERKKEL